MLSKNYMYQHKFTTMFANISYFCRVFMLFSVFFTGFGFVLLLLLSVVFFGFFWVFFVVVVFFLLLFFLNRSFARPRRKC